MKPFDLFKQQNLAKYKFIILLVIGVSITSCNQNRNGIVNGENYKLIAVDSSKNLFLQTKRFSGVIFAHHSLGYNKKKPRRFTPSVKEVFEAEQIFQKCLQQNKVGEDGLKISPKMIQCLSNYYRQYIGYYNEHGQKTIDFNCLAKTSTPANTEWKKFELATADGGNSYFSIQINLDTENCSLFMVNSRG